MSRVDQRQQESAREAERAQKQIDRNNRDNKTSNENRQKFSAMMKKGNEARQNEQTQGKKGNEARAQSQKQAEGKGKNARMAAMARGGGQASQRLMAQVKGFEGAMARAKGSTEKDTKANNTAREEGMFEAKVQTNDAKESDATVETHKEAEAEQTKEEMQAESKHNAAISGSGGRKGGKGGGGAGAEGDGQQNNEQAAQEMAKLAAKQGGAQGASKGQAVKKTQQIPAELIEKLVRAVFVGVNAQGMKEFQIDLKDGALAGARMKVTAGKDGRIQLAFEGVDHHTKNLLESSKGELMRRFEDKGLHLGEMKVTAKG